MKSIWCDWDRGTATMVPECSCGRCRAALAVALFAMWLSRALGLESVIEPAAGCDVEALARLLPPRPLSAYRYAVLARPEPRPVLVGRGIVFFGGAA